MMRDRWRTLRDDLGLLIRVHRLVLHDDWTRGRLLVAILCLQAAIPIAQLWLMRGIVNGLADGNGSVALGLGAIAAGAVLVAQMLTPVQMVLSSQIQDGGVAAIEREMIRAGTNLRDLTRISRSDYRDRMNAIRDGATEFGMTLSRAGRFYAGAIALIGMLVSLESLNPLMPLVLVVTGYFAHRLSRRQAELTYTALWVAARPGEEMRYAQTVATRPALAAEVRMFGIGPWLRDRYRRFARIALAEVEAKRRRGALLAVAGTAIHVVALAGSFWYVAVRAERGSLSVGDLALFINALVQAQVLTQDLFTAMNLLRGIILRARDFFPFVDEAAPEIALPAPGTGMAPASEPVSGIALRHIGFRYPESSVAILDDLSLDLSAGTVTALVGENGAGKSTLVNLLSRMFDPTAGTITLDGIPYAAYDLAALRRRMTAVFQDGARFAFSLEANIALGDPDFHWERDRTDVHAVAERVGVGRIAATLAHAYETELGRQFEDAVDLSGGQWQLVTFARGLIRDDAAVAMLDEPSSALDPIREREQTDRLRSFARAERRSVLLISHRLSTVRWADRIAVLERGKIVEAGSHDDLIAAGGAYATLFTMQANRYQETPAPAQP